MGGTSHPMCHTVSVCIVLAATSRTLFGIDTVMAIIGLLVAVGLALVAAAIWLLKATRPEPEFLNPLVVMGKKWWRSADPVWQRRSLDQHRAPDAEPLQTMADPPKLDVDFDTGPRAPGFDDIINDSSPGPDAQGEEAPGEEAPGESVEAVHHGRDDDAPVVLVSGSSDDQPVTSPLLDFPMSEIDPDILAAAEAALDAELRGEAPPTG